MMPKEKGLFTVIFNEFKKSLKPANLLGDYKGTDVLGNKYFERSTNLHEGRRLPRRWYEPLEGKDIEQQLPTEWETWLRNGRIDPPTEEEIESNTRLKNTRLKNAEDLALERGEFVEKKQTSRSSFPTYEEYELKPGDKIMDNKH